MPWQTRGTDRGAARTGDIGAVVVHSRRGGTQRSERPVPAPPPGAMVDRMDSRLDPSSPSPPYRVRLTAPSEIAAAIPHLLGFRPHASVVGVSPTGPGGRRVGLTIRADLPPPEHAAALAAALTRSIGTDRPSGVLLAVVSEEGDVHGPGGADVPHRALIHEL